MKLCELKLRVIAPLVVLSCLVCLGGAAAAQGQESFENGFPPPSWTYYGLTALGGAAVSTPGIAPTDGLHFGWISTGCVAAAGTTCPTVATAPTPTYASLGLGSGGTLGTPTKETFLMSPSFTLAASTTISFDVNFITTDGTNAFADFALVQLIPSTGSAINLFVANTTCDGCLAVPPAILNPADANATLNPSQAFFSGTAVTFGATTYGNVPKFGSTIDKGGPTGWIHVTYPALAGTYTLRFYVSHVGDTNYPSALAIDNIVGPPFTTTPVVTDGTTPTTVVFNSNTGQVVRHDVFFAATADMNFPLGPSPSLQMQSINRLLSNGTDWPPYVIGTPFAISHLLVHAGDNAVAGGTDIGSKYEDECFDATHPPAPNQCPYPNSPTIHIRAKDIFDFPPIKPAIDFGTTASFIHYYPNTITNLTAWSSSSTSPNPVCTSVTTPAFTCDLEDILVNIYGEPLYGSDSKRGSYASVYNVPMLLSAVKVNGTSVNTQGVQGSSPFFVHSPSLTFDFLVTPAKVPAGLATNFASIARTSNLVTATMSAVPAAWVNGTLLTINPNDTANFPPICAVISNVMNTTFQYAQSGLDANSSTGGTAANENCWVAAPVSNLFYRFDPLGSAPDLPGTTDLNDLTNCPANCTVTGTPGASSTAPVEFTSPAISVAPGQYLLQWSAADTAKIRERNVQLLTAAGSPCPNPFNESPAPMPPCYSTKLFSAQINVVNAVVQQPINPDGSSVFNAKRGVIPVKFTLNGATCALPPATIALSRIAGTTSTPIDESVYEMAADNESNFRISGCQYIYNLASKTLGAGVYRVDILINGVAVGSAVFALK